MAAPAVAAIAKGAKVAIKVGQAADAASDKKTWYLVAVGLFVVIGIPVAAVLAIAVFLAAVVMTLLPSLVDGHGFEWDLQGAGIPEHHMQAVIDAGDHCPDGDPRYVAAHIQSWNAGMEDEVIEQGWDAVNPDYEGRSEEDRDDHRWPIAEISADIDSLPYLTELFDELAADVDGNGQVSTSDELDVIDFIGRAHCHYQDALGDYPELSHLPFHEVAYAAMAMRFDEVLDHMSYTPADPYSPAVVADLEWAYRPAIEAFAWLEHVDLTLPNTPMLPETGIGAWGGYSNGRIPLSAMCELSFAAGHYARCDASQAATALNAAFKAQFGHDMTITSSYRSYEGQLRAKARHGRFAATPGTSNHGWGLALDIGGLGGYAGAKYQWIDANAHFYGYSQPAIMKQGGSLEEPWHWEYGRRD